MRGRRTLGVLIALGGIVQLLGVPGYYYGRTQLFAIGFAAVLLAAGYLLARPNGISDGA